MKPRTFAAIVGALFVLASLIGMLIQVRAPYDEPNPFNSVYGVNLHAVKHSDCGTAFAANSTLGDIGRQQSCESAVSGQRAWTIPLGVAGLVGLAGAAFISPGPRRRETAAG